MEEIWKSVTDHEGYEVSSLGRVRSVDRYVPGRIAGYRSLFRGRVLKTSIDKRTGYEKAILCCNGKPSTNYVHRLVARAFIGEAVGKEVNHKDRNKLNNSVANLEWCSRLENSRHWHAIEAGASLA